MVCSPVRKYKDMLRFKTTYKTTRCHKTEVAYIAFVGNVTEYISLAIIKSPVWSGFWVIKVLP
jgi:hypothetical protein